MLDNIPWLQFKSKREREREQQEYEKWAFPYGQAQSDKIKSILKELFPREDIRISMTCFLTAKEMFNSDVSSGYYSPELHDKSVNILRKELKYYRQLFPKGTDTLYLALGMADTQVGPELQYPSCDELRETAEYLTSEIKRVYDYVLEHGKNSL
ncbi:MAG: hypothetical protein IJ072_02120 [Oscillospiraceae bacterium]|nr:hypothetical protein [Oscillospiraceae bacterium]